MLMPEPTLSPMVRGCRERGRDVLVGRRGVARVVVIRRVSAKRVFMVAVLGVGLVGVLLFGFFGRREIG